MAALAGFKVESRKSVIHRDGAARAVGSAGAAAQIGGRRGGTASQVRTLSSPARGLLTWESPARDLPVRDLPVRDLPTRDLAARPLRARPSAGRRGAVHCDGASPGTMHGSRLTPRGRVVVAVVWIVLLGIAALIITNPSASPAGEAEAPTSKIEVQPGDTLWQLANEIQPDSDPREVVHAIVALNDLASAGDIHPGDTLVVPTRD